MHANGNAKYTLRYMRMDDIPQVTEVDKLSFPLPWSPRSYAFEIAENRSGHMIVVETNTEVAPPKGLMSVLQRLGGTVSTQPAVPVIAGYGGFWLIDGESHISTIAVHPTFRGKKLGELLLAGMIGRSMSLGADYVVLEVRVSNQSAINLYHKYEFKVVGERKNYYRDNNEDAYLMTLEPLDGSYKQRFEERWEKLHQQLNYSDHLSE
jgi:ribosomal-protein-alanine N-acetyltransferase